jgi:hypothetical protein
VANSSGDVKVDLIWRPNDQPVVAMEEFAAASVFRGMLADPDWLIPLVAAQVQYRSVYYGMTAAALLEDVWTDALANWLSRHRPSVGLEKVVRGALGDYKIDNLVTSHKSGLGPSQTAIHWDATATRGPNWISETAVTYLSAEYGRKIGTWTGSNSSGSARVVWPSEPSNPPRSRVALARALDGEDEWQLFTTWKSWPSFEEVWPHVTELLHDGVPAFDIEMFWLPEDAVAFEKGTIEFSTWPGVYLWPRGLLIDVPLSSNNRGSTLDKSVVVALMQATRRIAGSQSLFVRLPVWSARFAPPRPPDLYLALRATWDQRFSPVP